MKEIFQRVNQYLLFAVLLVVILYYGKVILIPIAAASLLAMLMAPLCERLGNKGVNRALSSLACVLILLFTFIAMIGIIGGQFAAFSEDLPKIEEKAKQFVSEAQIFIQDELGVSKDKQVQIAKEQAKSVPKVGSVIVAKFLGGLTGIIAGVALTLVYTFLMLYNKEHFESFFIKLYRDQEPQKVKKVVGQITKVSQKYLTGRGMSILIIATLYSIGLSLVGLKNAILLACVAAILTVIPYVGTILGGFFPVIMALATEDTIQPALWTGLVLFFIQTMDNYFIEPNIVGGEVNLSAIVSILSIIVGGMIWGVAGMILFLPLAGIVKIVCDHVEELKPIGHLLGEPGGKSESKIKKWISEKFGRKK